jgi:hypothetical protein
MGRMVIFPEQRLSIEDHLLNQNARTYFRVLMQMTAGELREAKSKEWAGPKRDDQRNLAFVFEGMFPTIHQ